ncbi:15130_t:CDS:2, partial [Racocetra fulgida]
MFSIHDFVPYVFNLEDSVVMLPSKTGGNISIEPKISDLGLAKIILDTNPEELNERQLKINDAFLKADEIISTLSTTSLQYRDLRYTSKAI